MHALAITALAVSIFSAAVIAVDVRRHPQSMAIMSVVWPITALYFGPVAVWYYFAHARSPKEPAFWHGVAAGTTHCGAGCVLGDFLGEWLVYFWGLSLAGSFAVDFGFAYIFGVVFQYYAIAPMRGVTGWAGIKLAMRADTVSLIAFEAGIFVFMGFTHHRVHAAPTSAVFWFLMQLAMIMGFGTSFPANWWLIRHHWKEI
jgi:hypothetical protein